MVASFAPLLINGALNLLWQELKRSVVSYTRSLVAAIPTPDPSKRIPGAIETDEPPSLFKPPHGCA